MRAIVVVVFCCSLVVVVGLKAGPIVCVSLVTMYSSKRGAPDGVVDERFVVDGRNAPPC